MKLRTLSLAIVSLAACGAGPRSEPTQQYAALRGARLVAADAAKHFVMLDDPAFLFAQLDSFLGAPR
jgi:pimeloyl-ACP methyl ester carboxylesterase